MNDALTINYWTGNDDDIDTAVCTVEGDGNTLFARFHGSMLTIEWGGDPTTFALPAKWGSDESVILDAINGELPEA